MKRVLLLLALALIIAGGIFAQENLNETFNVGNSLGFNPMETLSFNSGFQLDMMSDGGQREPFGGIPLVAGLMNMPLGLWSWLHQDWLGGGITAGLFIGGTILIITAEGDAGVFQLLAGVGMLLASPVYGFFRGMSQFRQMQAASFAEAINDNPLNNISFVALPTFNDGRVGAAGIFTYSLSY